MVSLSPSLVDELVAQLTHATHDLVFPSPGGEPLRRSNIYYRTWRPAIQAAGLQPAPRFHDLRHSHVAMLIAAGVPVKAIQDRLGHASIVMTMDRYGHLLQTVDATVLAAVDSGLSTIKRTRPQECAAPAVDDTSKPQTPVLPPEA